jgi:hypothetical protein
MKKGYPWRTKIHYPWRMAHAPRVPRHVNRLPVAHYVVHHGENLKIQKINIFRIYKN